MHNSSYQHMQRLVSTHLAPGSALKVVDIGSFDVNGSYRTLFTDPGWQYTGVDLEAGPGVDVVLDIVGNHGSPAYSMPKARSQYGKLYDRDGKLVAVSLSEGGSESGAVHIFETATGKKLDDKVEWVKFSGPSWHKQRFRLRLSGARPSFPTVLARRAPKTSARRAFT